MSGDMGRSDEPRRARLALAVDTILAALALLLVAAVLAVAG
ncbi:hypothetical protein ACGFYQ_37995 [Streptomyces sp. NPDC048258]